MCVCIGRWGVGLGVGIHHSHGFAPAPARAPAEAEKVLNCRQAPLNQLQLLLARLLGWWGKKKKKCFFHPMTRAAGSLGEAVGPSEPGRPPSFGLRLCGSFFFSPTPLESVGAAFKCNTPVPQTALCFDPMTGLVKNTLWTVYIFGMEIQLN